MLHADPKYLAVNSTELSEATLPLRPRDANVAPEQSNNFLTNLRNEIAKHGKLGIWGSLLAVGLTTASCSKEPASVTSNTISGAVSDDVENAHLITNLTEIKTIKSTVGLRSTVTEYENPETGNFTYIFTANGGKTFALKGVIAGANRQEVLKEIDSCGFTLEAKIQKTKATTISQVNDPSNGANNDLSNISRNILLVAAGALLLGHLMRRASGKGSSVFGSGLGVPLKKRSGLVDDQRGVELDEAPRQKFSDIGGLPHVIADLIELRDDILRVKSGRYASGLPKGILLFGPPGGGKTSTARALAGEAECPFIVASSPELTGELYVGTGQRAVHSLFSQARQARDRSTQKMRKEKGATGREEGLCIVFLDEFDSLGKSRDLTAMSGAGSEHDKALNALLEEMDGLDTEYNKNIIVIAATNAAHVLDKALLRPGRFTKQIEIPLPQSTEDRLDILQKIARPFLDSPFYKLDSASSLEYIARITPGLSGDHLRGIVHEAVALADRADREKITKEDLFEAFQRQLFGREKTSFIPLDKRILVAIHEHGHGIATKACDESVFLVSMNPRGESLGRVMPDPEAMSGPLPTLNDMMKRLLIVLGGRGAELEMYGQGGATSGASNDLDQARQLVKAAISLGLVGDMYSVQPSKAKDSELDSAQKVLIDKIINEGLATSRKIIAAVGANDIRTLALLSLENKRDMVGEEADDFYTACISKEKLAEIRNIAKQFIEQFGGPQIRA